MKVNKKLFIWLGVALVVVFAIVMGIKSLASRVNAVMEQFTQMEAVVERGDLEVWVSGNGTVTAAVEEAVRTGAAGTIETYLLEDGLQVAAGDELVTLKFQDLSTEIKLQELEIANLEEQKDNLEDQSLFVTVQAPAEGAVEWLKSEGDRVQGGDLMARIILPGSGNEDDDLDGGEESDGDESGGAEQSDAPKPVPVYAPSAASSWRIEDIIKKDDVAEGDNLVKLKNLSLADEIDHQLDLIEIQLEQARLRLADLKEQQRQNRADSVICAPISGTVVLPEPSEFGAGMSVPQGAHLATIVDYSQLQAVIPVDELDINKVKVGQQVEITAEALPGETISGAVTAISSTGKIVGSVSTFDVTISIDPVKGLKAGMSVSASILVDVRSNTLLVPIEAVYEQDGASMVMLAATEGEGGISPGSPVEVVTGAHNTTYIEILDGVTEGQKIIIQGSMTNPFGQQGELIIGPGQGGEGQ